MQQAPQALQQPLNMRASLPRGVALTDRQAHASRVQGSHGRQTFKYSGGGDEKA